jgi:hypothetical protein
MREVDKSNLPSHMRSGGVSGPRPGSGRNVAGAAAPSACTELRIGEATPPATSISDQTSGIPMPACKPTSTTDHTLTTSKLLTHKYSGENRAQMSLSDGDGRSPEQRRADFDRIRGELAQPGVKLDQGKPKVVEFFMQEFPRGIEAVARHGENTSSDPGHVPHGWKSVPDGFNRYTEAVGRHMTARESIINGAVARAWNAMAALEHLLSDEEGVAAGTSARGSGVV